MTTRVDMHMHTTASDGTDHVAALYEKLLEKGIDTFSVTDHDTIEAALLMEAFLGDKDSSMHFYKGCEFSCQYEGHKCHILAYDYDPACEIFQTLLLHGERMRKEKLNMRITGLREQFDIHFTEDELSYLHSLSSVGKPHMAKLLINKGLADSIDEAIKKYIDHIPDCDFRQDAHMVLGAISEAGGISVWAHPLGGEGEKRVDRDCFLYYLDHMKEEGLVGLECFYSRYDMEDVDFLKNSAMDRGLLISGGSDYHGRNKNITLTTLNADGVSVKKEELTLISFLEKRRKK